ncbi:MAG: hypothetical protein EA365_08370 [Gloeocapsa sp. DLM2.Bin57]|nr:MAG: hypothetical protein EA365_08370 [Gloeocapsa sp. DLM2.Bin57]
MSQKTLAIDRLATILILIFSLIIALLIWTGEVCGENCFLHTGPKVNYFSWENKVIGAEDVAFILGFDRPIDRQSVEASLSIEPPLPGRISWAGRRMAYTLNQPAPYGEVYQINIPQGQGLTGESLQPFVREVVSRDRALAFISTTGPTLGQLILYNFTTKEQKILTPANLIVTNFLFYPQGDKILFAAADKQETDAVRKQQLYTINTGLNGSNNQPELTLILDNKDYQNNQFDLSADGQKIVVQRIKRDNPLDFDLWLIESGKAPKPLNIQGGNFLIAPDSQTLAVAQGEGIALISLVTDQEPLNFLPSFGQVLTFSRDGSAAALVNFNTDNPDLRYTRSLFYVNNRGVKLEVFNTTGSIIDCEFNANSTHLYCLMTELIEGDFYQENPYFVVINLETLELIPLLELTNYQDMNISIAPDGLGLIFDQVITNEPQANQDNYRQVEAVSYLFSQLTNSVETRQNLRTNSGAEIIGGNLWLLLIPPTELNDLRQVSLEELPFVGFRPQWSP